MASQQLSRVVQHLRGMLAMEDAAGISDADLLKRYVHERDETAFEMLVRRHGPMVLGVCRRLLLNPHDAEDAFQVTFLVLVRKASALHSPSTIGNWLYGVAYRTALEARKASAKRRAKEAMAIPRAELTQDHRADLHLVLDQELKRLPDKHREVVVLCDLEGKTRKEAALDLGCAEGTVASRLARARTVLAKRLTRHGLSLSAGAMAVLLSEKAASACLPASVISSTIKAAGAYAAGPAAAAGVIATNVVALTQGVLRTMLLTKLKIATAVLVAITVVGVGAGSLIYQTQGAEDSKEKGKVPGRDQPKLQREEPIMKELEKLQGTWIAISGEHQGKQTPEEKIKQEELTLTIKGDRFILKKTEKAEDLKGTLKIDPTKQPKTMDWSANRPDDNLPLRFTGIYELKDDTLTFCYGNERPTEFKTDSDSDQTLYVWKRSLRDRSADAAKEQSSLPIEDLRSNWSGEKDGVKAKLTFYDPQAKWQAHWQVEYKRSLKLEDPSESPVIGVNKGADLKCAADPTLPGRLNLYLPIYLGDQKEIKESSWNGRIPVGYVEKIEKETLRLRIIPTGYENVAEKNFDFPAVEGMILHRVNELADAKEEFFVVGPYALGDLYRDTKDEQAFRDLLAEELGEGGGSAEADLLKFFNGCNLYVIDKRDVKDQTLAEGKDWSPKVATVGKLSHEFNGKKGQEVTVQIVEVRMMRGSDITDNTTSPPHRSLHVLLEVRLASKSGRAFQRTWNFDSGRFTYDVRGVKRP